MISQVRKWFYSLLHKVGFSVGLRFLRVRRNEVAILMFHRVSDQKGLLWEPLPVSAFRHLMREIAANARVIALEEIGYLDEYSDQPLIVLSFDDGYMDFFENAMPILQDFNLPAHHNVCPELLTRNEPPWTQLLESHLATKPTDIELPDGRSYEIRPPVQERDLITLAGYLFNVDDDIREQWINSLDKDADVLAKMQLMGWQQLEACLQAGVTVGSHSLNHRNLAKICDVNILRREIVESRLVIRKYLGVDTEIFSFPNGLFDEQSIEVVRQSGYKYTLICNDRLESFNQWKSQSFFVLQRVGIQSNTWQEEYLRSLGLHQTKLYDMVMN